MRSMFVCAVGLAAAAAQADTIDLVVFENADNADVSGLDINVDIVDGGGGDVNFVFSSDSTTESFVSAIYVEMTNFSTGALANGAVVDESGATFTPPATPPNPPGAISNFGGPWGGILYSADMIPGNGNGIDIGDYVTLGFDLLNANTVQDIFDAAAADPALFRFAAHVQGIDGSSVWVTNGGGDMPPVVPLPPAGLAGLGLLGGLGVFRFVRRR